MKSHFFNFRPTSMQLLYDLLASSLASCLSVQESSGSQSIGQLGLLLLLFLFFTRYLTGYILYYTTSTSRRAAVTSTTSTTTTTYKINVYRFLRPFPFSLFLSFSRSVCVSKSCCREKHAWQQQLRNSTFLEEEWRKNIYVRSGRSYL